MEMWSGPGVLARGPGGLPAFSALSTPDSSDQQMSDSLLRSNWRRVYLPLLVYMKQDKSTETHLGDGVAASFLCKWHSESLTLWRSWRTRMPILTELMPSRAAGSKLGPTLLSPAAAYSPAWGCPGVPSLFPREPQTDGTFTAGCTASSASGELGWSVDVLKPSPGISLFCLGQRDTGSVRKKPPGGHF